VTPDPNAGDSATAGARSRVGDSTDAGERTNAALRALAEPNRRAILSLVTNQEMAAGEIAAHFAVTRPAISQHLGVLRDAGLITERRVGTRRRYRLRPEGIDELRAFLETLWSDALGRFKARAEDR
jgi:DNA-binding transcriptional ArsR family regulator